MAFNNQITPQSIDNETGVMQTTQSSTLRRCIRSKCTWMIFAILIILVITIPTTMILTRKQNPQETLTTTLTTTGTIVTRATMPPKTSTIVTTAKSSTTTEGIDILMNTTGIPRPLITLNPNCNVTDCRAIIADYVSKGWMFDTEKFHQCNDCPHMAYIEPPLSISADWVAIWPIQDFFIKNFIGQDCENSPIRSHMIDCVFTCFTDTTCVGFSRQKNIRPDDENGECWLKTNVTVNQIPNDSEWHTIVFNPPS